MILAPYTPAPRAVIMAGPPALPDNPWALLAWINHTARILMAQYN